MNKVECGNCKNLMTNKEGQKVCVFGLSENTVIKPKFNIFFLWPKQGLCPSYVKKS